MAKILDENETFVGGQWGANKAKDDPPATFEKGVAYRPMPAASQLMHNLGIYGVGGVIAPFVGIKLIDLAVAGLGLA